LMELFYHLERHFTGDPLACLVVGCLYQTHRASH
jgi:hypothetical protein